MISLSMDIAGAILEICLRVEKIPLSFTPSHIFCQIFSVYTRVALIRINQLHCGVIPLSLHLHPFFIPFN